MINPFDDVNWRPNEKDLRSFGRSMLLGFSGLSILAFVLNISRLPLDESVPIPAVLFLVGVFFFLVSRLGTPVALPFYWVWYALAGSIGIVVANLLLLLFFYVFFSGFAVVFRIVSGRDPLSLKKDPNVRTWWRDRVGKRNLKSYFKQY